MTLQRFKRHECTNALAASARFAEKSASLAALAAFACACSGPSLATASSEPGCPACSVIAESDTAFVELQSHDDALFVLDERGAIFSLPKLSGELTGVVAAGSGPVHFGVTQTMLAWVGPSDQSGTLNNNRVRGVGRDGSDGPAFQDFRGAALLGVGLGDAFVGAISADTGGSEVIRYSLDDGKATTATETLTDEETSELPVVAAADAEAVWCRTHADSSSTLWRLGGSGDPTSSEYPFSCASLWASGDGQVVVQDTSTGVNCYFRIDTAGASAMLACTSHDYEHFTPLADGSTAFVDDGAAVRRITTDGEVSLLFEAEYLIGIQRDGDVLYYATPAHIGTVSVAAAL